ncbi:putative lipoprotein [Salinisphaera sp. PC39]|uniref:DUF3613 domain-containing protein n=1 Tax=Salinisphaera sp. PC39 TaxID=1304156 RepID=UPI003341F2EC
MRLTIMMLLAAIAGTAAAAGPTDVGKATQDALAMQRDGDEAAPVRPMLEDAADRAYERYLESFSHPIPERYEGRESFSSDG